MATDEIVADPLDQALLGRQQFPVEHASARQPRHERCPPEIAAAEIEERQLEQQQFVRRARGPGRLVHAPAEQHQVRKPVECNLRALMPARLHALHEQSRYVGMAGEKIGDPACQAPHFTAPHRLTKYHLHQIGHGLQPAV